MSVKVTRRIQFCSGHRVLGHEGKCSNVHGHNYVALLEAQSINDPSDVDDIGRVIDFSVLKEKIGGWIMENWDHGFIVNHEDRDLLKKLSSIDGSRAPWVAPFNPTAENMAMHLLYLIGPQTLAGTSVQLTKVTLWETENCFAEVCL